MDRVQHTVTIAPGVEAGVTYDAQRGIGFGTGLTGVSAQFDPHSGSLTLSGAFAGRIGSVTLSPESFSAKVGVGGILGLGPIYGQVQGTFGATTPLDILDTEILIDANAKFTNVFTGTVTFNVQRSSDIVECFPAGTLIETADRGHICIEELVAGVEVSCFSSCERGESKNRCAEEEGLVAGKVVRTFTSITEEWIELHFTDPRTGKAASLTATPGHVMLTPAGGFKQLVQMIKAQSNAPCFDAPSDAQRLGYYAGTVELFTADSHIVTAQAWAIQYSAATAHLYEEAEMLVTRTEGGLAVKPEVKKGWKTYNFEVEKYHTYVAGGIRVHNQSEVAYYGYGGNVPIINDYAAVQAASERLAMGIGSSSHATTETSVSRMECWEQSRKRVDQNLWSRWMVTNRKRSGSIRALSRASIMATPSRSTNPRVQPLTKPMCSHHGPWIAISPTSL